MHAQAYVSLDKAYVSLQISPGRVYVVFYFFLLKSNFQTELSVWKLLILCWRNYLH